MLFTGLRVSPGRSEPWEAPRRVDEHSHVKRGQLLALWWADDARHVKVVVKREDSPELAGAHSAMSDLFTGSIHKLSPQ